MKIRAFFLLLLTSVFFQLEAHVELVNPQGGENYVPGTIVNVQWHETVRHETMNWDLLFSGDGGTTWDTIKADISLETTSHPWVVPDMPTTEGRIQIVQDNVNGNYSSVSKDFTITYPVGFNEQILTASANVYPNPSTDFFTVEFENPGRRNISLLIYDLQGRLVRVPGKTNSESATIYRGDLHSGLYLLQLEDNNKAIFIGKLLIR